jgi:anti-anti-sigma factor
MPIEEQRLRPMEAPMTQNLAEVPSAEARLQVQVLRFHADSILDPRQIELIEALFREAVAARPLPLIVLDLVDVQHVCSAMLGAFIELREMTLDAGGRIAISNLQPRLRDLLETVRPHGLFENYATTDAAVAALLA